MILWLFFFFYCSCAQMPLFRDELRVNVTYNHPYALNMTEICKDKEGQIYNFSYDDYYSCGTATAFPFLIDLEQLKILEMNIVSSPKWREKYLMVLSSQNPFPQRIWKNLKRQLKGKDDPLFTCCRTATEVKDSELYYHHCVLINSVDNAIDKQLDDAVDIKIAYEHKDFIATEITWIVNEVAYNFAVLPILHCHKIAGIQNVGEWELNDRYDQESIATVKSSAWDAILKQTHQVDFEIYADDAEFTYDVMALLQRQEDDFWCERRVVSKDGRNDLWYNLYHKPLYHIDAVPRPIADCQSIPNHLCNTFPNCAMDTYQLRMAKNVDEHGLIIPSAQGKCTSIKDINNMVKGILPHICLVGSKRLCDRHPETCYYDTVNKKCESHTVFDRKAYCRQKGCTHDPICIMDNNDNKCIAL
jgi:hypothetical protein